MSRPAESGGQIPFDQAQAQETLDAIRAAIARVRATTEVDLGNGRRAQDGWTGVYGDRFRAIDLPWIHSEADRILGGLLALQRSISSASASAADQERQRERAGGGR